MVRIIHPPSVQSVNRGSWQSQKKPPLLDLEQARYRLVVPRILPVFGNKRFARSVPTTGDECVRQIDGLDRGISRFSHAYAHGTTDARKPGMMSRISVVVPMYNEEENVRPLVGAVRSALEGREWELLVVDDGSTDGTYASLREEAEGDSRVRVVRLARNYGQTPAMQAGFDAARGDVVVTMDGDLQNDPRDIPLLLDTLAEGYDLVAGYRVARQDRTLTRKLPSWIANRLIRGLTRVDIRDNGCSLKAYRTDLLRRLHLYSDMHRFIPAVAAGAAGARITEVPVRHHARRHGASKYGLSRIGKVLADLLVIVMIRSFRQKPLRLFAMAAVVSAVLGAITLVAGVWTWPGAAETGRVVYPSASLLWFFLASYLLFVGLVAETAVGEMTESRDADVIVREVE
jgi:hypothetical protein